METSPQPTLADDLRLLREGIKRRYAQYHTANRDKYPLFDFNSNRINYQPLRDSFEEEFFERRQLDRVHNHLHIPSLSTLAQLFTNDDYVPTRKIAYTCRSYALPNDPLSNTKLAESEAAPMFSGRKRHPVWLVGLVGAALLAILAGVYWLQTPKPQKLTIRNLTTGQAVPRLVQVVGAAPPTDSVWLVVRPVVPNNVYYLQGPFEVSSDGTWVGTAIIGQVDHQSDGYSFTIRAFVRLGGSYTQERIKAGQTEFTSWPEEAGQATEPIVVVRARTN